MNSKEQDRVVESLGYSCPTFLNATYNAAQDEVKSNEDKLIDSSGAYDDYYGNMETLDFERLDGSKYQITIYQDPCSHIVYRAHDELKGAISG